LIKRTTVSQSEEKNQIYTCGHKANLTDVSEKDGCGHKAGKPGMIGSDESVIDSTANAETMIPMEPAANNETMIPIDSTANTETAKPIDSTVNTETAMPRTVIPMGYKFLPHIMYADIPSLENPTTARPGMVKPTMAKQNTVTYNRHGSKLALQYLKRSETSKAQDVFDMYFVRCKPFGEGRKEYKWWIAHGIQQFLKMPKCYELEVLMQLWNVPWVCNRVSNSGHILIGIYENADKGNSFFVVGVPSGNMLGDKHGVENVRKTKIELKKILWVSTAEAKKNREHCKNQIRCEHMSLRELNKPKESKESQDACGDGYWLLYIDNINSQ
jgi:hypothetical protein